MLQRFLLPPILIVLTAVLTGWLIHRSHRREQQQLNARFDAARRRIH